jgi:ribosomal protein S27AE
MTLYQPATVHSDSIKRPTCSKCGSSTFLFGIEPEKPGHELWSFDCPKCHHIETVVGKSE